MNLIWKILSFLLLLLLLVLFAYSSLADEMLIVTLSDEGILTTAEDITVEGTVVIITRPGDYLLSGTLSNGQIVVNCDVEGEVTLHLNGVNIHNAQGPAILIGDCTPQVVISLENQSENILTNGAELVFIEDDEPNGVIFSHSDLTISGSGRLMITARAMDGIVSKDDLVIKGGTLVINAARHGLRGKDSVDIENGNLIIYCGKDGIKSTNTKDTERGFLLLNGGDIRITCGDDPLSFVTGCTISNATLQIQLIQ